MPITDADLDYETHIGVHKDRGQLTGDPAQDRYWHLSAQELHAIIVADAMNKLAQRAGQLGLQLPVGKGRYHLQFGALRRGLQIGRSFRNLMAIIRPDRDTPLKFDYAHEVERDLNVIYINLRGLLDNLAESIYEQLGADHFKGMQEQRIGLFNKTFRKAVGNEKLEAFIHQHDAWNLDFKERRDPSAHGIPLSVPPAALDDKTLPEYRKLEKEWSVMTRKAAETLPADGSAEIFKQANEIFAAMQKVGSFKPIFLHHPEEGAQGIYPTVPQDIGRVIVISRGVLDIMEDQFIPPRPKVEPYALPPVVDLSESNGSH